MLRQMAELEKQLQALRLEKEKLEEVEAERERGSAKGRTFEEAVADAVDRIALAQGDVAEAVGDLKEATGKVGDVVVAHRRLQRARPRPDRVRGEGPQEPVRAQGASRSSTARWPSGAPTSPCWSCPPTTELPAKLQPATRVQRRQAARRARPGGGSLGARVRLPARARPRADEALGRGRHRRRGAVTRRRGARARRAHRGAQDQAAAHRRQDQHRQGRTTTSRGWPGASAGCCRRSTRSCGRPARPRRRRRTTSSSSRAAARRCSSSCGSCRSGARPGGSPASTAFAEPAFTS